MRNQINHNLAHGEVFNTLADSMPEGLGHWYTSGCLRLEGSKKDTSFMEGFYGKTFLTGWKDSRLIIKGVKT